MTYIAVCRAASKPPGADGTREEEEIGSCVLLSSKNAVKESYAACLLGGYVGNKNPDIFQTFDPTAFSACFFMLRTLDSLGFFFPLKICFRDKE